MNYRFLPQIQQASMYAAHEKRSKAWGRNIISFVDEMTTEALVAIDVIQEAEKKAADWWTTGSSLLRAVAMDGYEPFRQTIAARMAARGWPVTEERVIAVTGVQQAVDAAARVLTAPGDAVLVESPSNPAVLRTLTMNGLRVIPVGRDESGIDLEDAERLIQLHRPRMIYAMPTVGIPGGQSWSLERRQGLLALGHTHNILIVEDDSNGQLGFHDTVPYPTLYALAGSEGGVLYMGAIPAAVVPHVRHGWTAGDVPLIAMMREAIRSAGAEVSLYEQSLITELMGKAELDTHIRKLASCYSQRMNRLMLMLEEGGPVDLAWSAPQGGSCLWLRLPEGLDGEALLRGTLRKEVAFEPGAVFFADNPQCNTARLSVASIADDQLERGVELFLETIQEFTARS